MPDFGIKWPLGLGREDLVGAGITALVVRLDAVVKFFKPTKLQFLERETAVYHRLGYDHSGIIEYFGVLGNGIICNLRNRHLLDNMLRGRDRSRFL